MRIKSNAVTFSFLAAFALLLFSFGCKKSESVTKNESVTTEEEVHWSYEGEGGPSHWGTLEPEYAACDSGTSQSPINIVDANARKSNLPDILITYQATIDTLVNNGHTIQSTVPAGSHIQINGTRYELLQFHFHSFSEHTFEGEHAQAELHLVHKNSTTGVLAVLGVTINAGAENTAYNPILNNLPRTEGATYILTSALNPETLLPADRRTYRYDGSLTTPACSQGVKWNVMKAAVTFSYAQLAKFRELFNDNYRPVLPLNGRVVEYDTL